MPFWLLVIVTLFALIGHAVLWVGFVNRIHGVGMNRRLMDTLTFAAGVILVAPFVFALWSLITGELSGLLGNASLLVKIYGGFCLGVLGVTAMQSLVRRANAMAQPSVAQQTQRVVDLAPLLGTNIMMAGLPRLLSRLPKNEIFQLHLEEKTLLIPGLPSELAGLKIAQLSDLHMSGRVGVAYFEEVVRLANDWQPDLMALTGDLVEYTRCLPWVETTLAQLTAPQGVYFVLGNHDLKCDHALLRQQLVAAGQVDLGSAYRDLEIRGVKLRLAGNELPWFRPPANLAKANADNNADATFVLAHGPDQFPWAKQHNAALILAGHNHGGQIRFPLLGAVVTPSIYGTKYAAGVFREGQTVMHVSRGTSSLAPVRWNCPPELSLLTLEPA